MKNEQSVEKTNEDVINKVQAAYETALKDKSYMEYATPEITKKLEQNIKDIREKSNTSTEVNVKPKN